jgi:hypothetical protein
VTYNPEFEWREAARWARYTWEEFAALDGEAQSAVIAHYRGHMQLEAVMTQDQVKKQRQQGRRRGRS